MSFNIGNYCLGTCINEDYITLEVTFTPKVNTTSEVYTIVNHEEGGYGIQTLTGNSSKYVGSINAGNTYYKVGNTNVSINEKVSLTITYDGISLKMYKNGVLCDTKYITGIIQDAKNAAPLVIGGNPHGYAGVDDAIFAGDVYSVRVYNRALTSYEVINNFNVDKVKFDVYDIPIYNTEQLAKIGSGEKVNINNVRYNCSPEAKYMLMENLILDNTDIFINNEYIIKNMDFNNHTITIGDYVLRGYLESSGTQYINTGIVPNNNTGIEIAFRNYGDANKIIFGSENAWKSNSFEYHTNDHGLVYSRWRTVTDLSVSSATKTFLGDTQKHILKLYTQKYYFDEKLYYTFSNTWSGTYPIYLFTLDRGGVVTQSASCKIYYCKLWNGENLVSYMLPALNQTNELGMYDIVRKTFYTNGGTEFFE